MTSPVDTSVKYFSSLMTGAPVLSGTAGALVALLDACLKDGFDTKTLTSLVALGGVMTATWASGAHSSQIDSVVLVAGVAGGPVGSAFAGANGEQKIVSRPTNLTATWATALPDGTYTGTITMKMAPLGFAKPFSTTNVAAYQSTDPASTKMILRLDDTGATTCRVVGCEVMSDIATYSGIFPTTTQISGGGYWGKSGTANSVAQQWALFGDSRGFFLHVCPSYGANNASVQGVTRYFGDIIAFRPGGDNYGASLSYSQSSASTSQQDGQPELNSQQQAMPRAVSGLGTGQQHVCAPYTGAAGNTSGSDVTFGPFPSPIDGTLRLSKRFLALPGGASPPRGDMPGLYSAPHSLCADSFKFNDRIVGTGILSGRSLFVVNPATTTVSGVTSSSNSGASFLDITGPWR
ncbi:hypothetical protein J2W34_000737 [Variovorax boronicumulans]|uniref:hypothetical protein n=1 Tax=Variovorax boronicumulans TaxID=436515 RepID=UPI002787600D|nr:hypothetical protein [Variovorax boronicumulans]MDQ0068963.1 hypothetical protein [Variovorax boronicumulans]